MAWWVAGLVFKGSRWKFQRCIQSIVFQESLSTIFWPFKESFVLQFCCCIAIMWAIPADRRRASLYILRHRRNLKILCIPNFESICVSSFPHSILATIYSHASHVHAGFLNYRWVSYPLQIRLVILQFCSCNFVVWKILQ